MDDGNKKELAKKMAASRSKTGRKPLAGGPAPN